MHYEIIPGILEENQNKFEEKFKLATQFAQTIQVDIIDQIFAQKTITPNLDFTRNYPVALELHLMVNEPEKWLKNYNGLNLKRIIGHVEFMKNIPNFISAVKELNTQAFLGIDLPTNIAPYLNHQPTGFLIMTVKAGKSGQEFDESALNKVTQVREKLNEIDIEIDGGVTKNNIPQSLAAGVNLFAATSAIFKQDPELEFGLLKSLLPSDKA